MSPKPTNNNNNSEQSILLRSEDPKKDKDKNDEGIEGYIKKARTGSVRVVAQRPSFLIIR